MSIVVILVRRLFRWWLEEVDFLLCVKIFRGLRFGRVIDSD